MLTYKEAPTRLYADFCRRNSTGQELLGMTLKILKDKSYQPRILYPPKSSFRDEGEKSFPRQKVERVHHHYTCLTRMKKGALLSVTKEQKYKSLSKVG